MADKGKNENMECHHTLEKGHGRIEERNYYYSGDVSWMQDKKDWMKLNSIGMVIRKCEENGIKTEESSCYICSVANVKDFA
ncbi:hypothetical protein [Clostridium sp. BJN0013]|uniref:hypothetical protein n=1 Tax=Clostridium sp. BJN0013 TaxID=3236840 RepID=UPI0034C6480C